MGKELKDMTNEELMDQTVWVPAIEGDWLKARVVSILRDDGAIAKLRVEVLSELYIGNVSRFYTVLDCCLDGSIVPKKCDQEKSGGTGRDKELTNWNAEDLPGLAVTIPKRNSEGRHTGFITKIDTFQDAAGTKAASVIVRVLRSDGSGFDREVAIKNCFLMVSSKPEIKPDVFTDMEDCEETLKYVKLRNILDRAFNQAVFGKGKERHSTGQNFEDQPIMSIQEMLGSNHGALFQAVKKIQESVRLDSVGAVIELLGAIVYLASAVIYIEGEKD